jgi:subtilisin family serine protease
VSSIVAGIEWAVKNDINIINMSLGSSQDSQTLHDACDAAYGAGLLIISSAGNSGNPAGRGDNVGYPAKYSSVVAVAASDSNDRRASFSSTGPAVELIAPGVSVLSTTPNNTYSTYSGTSMASPHVAGVAALVWAVNPELTNAEVRQILIDTAENLGLSANHQGYGLVRADLAVAATGGSTEPDPDPEPEPEPEPGDVIMQVSGIVYATRANNRHLDVSLTVLEKDSTTPVSNVSVSVEFYRNNALYANRTGTTGSDGKVTFSFNNAPSGTYSTEVKSVTKDGYLWDGETPDNTFTK